VQTGKRKIVDEIASVIETSSDLLAVLQLYSKNQWQSFCGFFLGAGMPNAEAKCVH